MSTSDSSSDLSGISSAPVEELRGRIDAIDEALVRLLHERAALAAALGLKQEAAGLPLTDAAREEEVLARVAALPGSLSGSALRHIFTAVIDSCRAHKLASLQDRRR